MSFEERRKGTLPSSGPFLAEIVNHADPSYMGRLEVVLKKALPGNIDKKAQTYIVKYMTPFYTAMSARFEGNDSGKFNDAQKSAGLWMIPPDVGTTVIVMFIEGDPNEGYWLGCVPDTYANHMVPGIAASSKVAMTPEQRKRYGVEVLPVAEFNKKTKKESTSVEQVHRPVHPFAERLLAQGLLADNIRGVTSSSARRDAPSAVFGISTPGPVDRSPGAKTANLGYVNKEKQYYVSRLGGSTFVMDDGDKKGQNELVRIRTRTGHQILLHNSSDLIYIANGAGTAWIELTANGKIDVYAADSVSIHSENDFNFRADRDVNIEAGRNFNMRSYGDFNINSDGDYNLIALDGKLFFDGNFDQTVSMKTKIISSGDAHIRTGNLFISSAGVVNLTGKTNNFTSAGNTNILSGGEHRETASKIHMNGPAAAKAAAPLVADSPLPLPTFSLPARKTSAGWANGVWYKTTDISSIMQRVPMHEPWDQHENNNPAAYKPTSTDSAAASTAAGATVSPNRQDAVPNRDQPADWTKDIEFIDKVKELAKKLRCDYIDLLAVIFFESRCNTTAKNPNTGATGLIQFMPKTAIALGTTTTALAAMSRVEQLDYAWKYFSTLSPQKNILKIAKPGLSDLYMSVFAPAYIGALGNTAIYKAGSDAYTKNIELDTKFGDGNGEISKEEATRGPAKCRPIIIQKLANAGIITNVLRDSSGALVTDGNGNPILTGQ